MNSIYQRLRAQNLCNHRQLANIGVNGARVTSMSPPGGIIESFTPDAALDAPSLVIHALIGNDVCNGHPGTSSMTTVEEFQAAVLASLDYLDANLPAGSHVAFLGLVDGRILFDTTKSRIHPLGVTYPALYDYLGCTGSSPCLGWLNSNETMRNITSERAANLTSVYDAIIAVNGSAYKNFDLYRLQVDWPELLANYTAHGGDPINVIEPVVRARTSLPPLADAGSVAPLLDALHLHPRAILSLLPRSQPAGWLPPLAGGQSAPRGRSVGRPGGAQAVVAPTGKPKQPRYRAAVWRAAQRILTNSIQGRGYEEEARYT
jgi:hypothetical protein